MGRMESSCKLIFNTIIYFSGKGDTVVSILTDLNDFWTYENREYLVPDTAEESEI